MNMREVRCCCHPENLIGYLPEDTMVGILKSRQLEDGTWAFEAPNHDHDVVKNMAGFVTAEGKSKKKKWKR